MKICLNLPIFLLIALRLSAADSNTLRAWLATPIIDTNLPLAEVQAFTAKRISFMPQPQSAAGWDKQAAQIRREVLDKIIFRGPAAEWRKAKTKVVWLDTIEGGPEYQIKKLRYEALPGFWIPALLYEPKGLSGKVPIVLNVNGHEPAGKSVGYKQIRCINQAKRGMLALNPEWLGMGQLRLPNYHHGRMAQLDLCGASGVAVFYLAMQRGLDLLLEHPNADPQRAAVAGLSGGGWQTIVLSSLDTRVKLCNPVAGYSSFLTRVSFLEDLGENEQTPCDLATIADYLHLTALLAPRPALLTYNAKDDCCFASAHALKPLLDAALPIYKLYGKESALRSHVNDDPGTHNFGKENREVFYKVLGDFFYPGTEFNAQEIPCDAEVKANTVLNVELPADNANFNSLALALSQSLPRQPAIPSARTSLERWQTANRKILQDVTRTKSLSLTAERIEAKATNQLQSVFWKFKMDGDWTVPAVELSAPGARETVIIISDAGRQEAVAEAAQWLEKGRRVLAVDLFYFGESRIRSHAFLFALMVGTVGERPLGVQAAQLNAIARWARKQFNNEPATVVALGPRHSLIALVAAASEQRTIAGLELRGSLGSLRELIQQNRAVEQMPEMFCFGLLEHFDIPQLAALAAPRLVTFHKH